MRNLVKSTVPGGWLGLLVSGLLACAIVWAGDAPPNPQPAPPNMPPPPVPRPAPVPGRLPPGLPPMAGPIGMPGQTPAAMLPGVEDMTNPNYLLDLARIHMQYGALDRADELLRKAQPLAKEPEVKAQIAVQLAGLLQSKQDYKGAAVQLEEAVAQTTNVQVRSQYAMQLSDLYARENQLDKAEKVLTDLLASFSSEKGKSADSWVSVRAYQSLLNLWQRQEGKVEKMRAATEEALAKDPQNRELLERLGHLYTAQKPDYAKAAGVYEKLLQQTPDDRRLLAELSTAYQQTRQYDKAIEIQQKIMAADPKGAGPFAAYQIAQLLLASGKKEEAVKWAKEHLPAEGSSALLANFFEQAGMLQEALEGFVKLREQAQQPQQKADFSLRIAEIALRSKDYKRAEEEAQKVLKDFPDNQSLAARANSTLARLKQAQGGGQAQPVAPPVPPKPPTPPAK